MQCVCDGFFIFFSICWWCRYLPEVHHILMSWLSLCIQIISCVSILFFFLFSFNMFKSREEFFIFIFFVLSEFSYLYQQSLCNARVAIVDLRDSVRDKRKMLQLMRQKLKLTTILKGQVRSRFKLHSVYAPQEHAASIHPPTHTHTHTQGTQKISGFFLR